MAEKQKSVNPSALLAPVGETVKRLDLPGYYEDPFVAQTQQQLAGLGGGLIKGDIPDYYKDIGRAGGGAFEKMLASVKTGVSKGIYEDIARRPGRGGLATDVIGRTMGDIGAKYRWQDLLRATQGKQFLMGAGADILSGVRGAGLTTGAGRRAFDLSQAELAFGGQQFEKKLGTQQFEFGEEMTFKEKQLAAQIQMAKEAAAAQQKQAKSAMWGKIISGALGAAGTVFGGPIGGALAGKLGSSAIGGLTGDISEIMPVGGLGLRG